MILSKTFLVDEAGRRGILGYGESEFRIVNENAQQATEFDYDGRRIYDVFLSHSSLDKKLILTLVEIFNDAKYSVYVD